MPLEHRIDEIRNLAIARVEGAIDPDALIAYLAGVEQDDRLRPGYRWWFDLSDAEPTGLGAEFVRRAAGVARRFDARSGRARVAVVAPGDFFYGLARMYSMLVDGMQREVRVFRDAAEARAWLCATDDEGEGESAA